MTLREMMAADVSAMITELSVPCGTSSAMGLSCAYVSRSDAERAQAFGSVADEITQVILRQSDLTAELKKDDVFYVDDVKFRVESVRANDKVSYVLTLRKSTYNG